MTKQMMTILILIITLQFSCDNNGEATKINNKEKVVHEIDEQLPIQELGLSTENEGLATKDEVEHSVAKSGPTKKEDKQKKEVTTKAENTEVQNVEAENMETKEAKEVVKVAEDRGRVKPEVKDETESKVEEVKSEQVEIAVAKPDHSVFNSLLSAHVSNKGVVNYNGIKGDIGQLDAYLKDLDENTIASDWSRNEKLAYWINAYNAFTIKLILDNYPVKSIQDIAGGKPWDKKWINLGGKTYSLNQIENDIIRPQFNEPRIHFAVNCAAQSCPPLANKAFTADNLNSLLDKQTIAFINNAKFNTISKNKAQVSKIFDWYGVDFGDKLAFLNKYAETQIAAGTEITYTDYDWALNNQ